MYFIMVYKDGKWTNLLDYSPRIIEDEARRIGLNTSRFQPSELYGLFEDGREKPYRMYIGGTEYDKGYSLDGYISP